MKGKRKSTENCQYFGIRIPLWLSYL